VANTPPDDDFVIFFRHLAAEIRGFSGLTAMPQIST
jgi:hypothetical protein